MSIDENPLISKIREIRARSEAEHAQMTPEQRAAKEEERERERISDQLNSMRRAARAACGLEDAMWERTFDTFPVEHESQAHALHLARLFVDKFPGPKGERMRRGLMLWGQPGRGKSGIMQALVQAILSKPKLYRVLYLPCAEIEAVNQRIDVLQAIFEAHLVVFDDIEKGLDAPGTKYHTPSHKLIKTAINRIDRNKRPVVCVTSNYPLDSKSKDHPCHKQRWPAIASRLSGMVVECPIDGSDKRPDIEQHELKWWAE